MAARPPMTGASASRFGMANSRTGPVNATRRKRSVTLDRLARSCGSTRKSALPAPVTPIGNSAIGRPSGPSFPMPSWPSSRPAERAVTWWGAGWVARPGSAVLVQPARGDMDEHSFDLLGGAQGIDVAVDLLDRLFHHR